MERILSVEEKIRRAEEIYARRHELDNKATFRTNVSNKEKKDMKLFKKLFLQMIACLLIYLIFFTIKNNNYIFTEDFINKSKEILSYDININEIYQNINGYISSLIQNDKAIKNKDNAENTENGIGGSSTENGIGGSSTENGIGGSSAENGIGGSSAENGIGGSSTEERY